MATYQASPVWIQIPSLLAYALVLALSIAVFVDLHGSRHTVEFLGQPNIFPINLSGQALLLFSYFLISSIVAFAMEVPGLKSLQKLMARFVPQCSTILGRGTADMFFGLPIIICFAGYLHGADHMNSVSMAMYRYGVATTVIGAFVFLVGIVKAILGFLTPEEAPKSDNQGLP